MFGNKLDFLFWKESSWVILGFTETERKDYFFNSGELTDYLILSCKYFFPNSLVTKSFMLPNYFSVSELFVARPN
jgi:hypothetical protein